MTESAPQSALLRTGETDPNANATECLGYGDGGNGRWRQLQQREKVTKTEVGSALWIRTMFDAVHPEPRGEFQNLMVLGAWNGPLNIIPTEPVLAYSTPAPFGRRHSAHLGLVVIRDV
jgi:hypothetical protein